MRTRLLWVLTIVLLFTLTACNSNKPADNSANSMSQNSASNSAGNASGGGNATSTSAPAPAAARTPAPPPPPPPVVIPAGTNLTVRLGDTLSSKTSSPGDAFSATLAEAVAVGGNVVIPAGARATGTVVDAKPLGRFKGGASLEIRLTSITINGAPRSIQTAAVSRTEKGKGKRTAVMAGGGGALGAIIGGIAGGGKGAAIGALAGGGAGGAGAAFTGNKNIELPAETALTFKLTASLEVKQ
ncbi:MAG TPA: hypothetical protein VL983_06845 [Terriglobales bacterium]|nr:hypothetical protein [Terriglobales bacterium]